MIDDGDGDVGDGDDDDNDDGEKFCIFFFFSLQLFSIFRLSLRWQANSKPSCCHFQTICFSQGTVLFFI
jgi:hypothetical protein